MAYPLFAAACWVFMQAAHRHVTPAPSPQTPATNATPRPSLVRALSESSTAVVAYVFFEMVVGLVNMFAFAGNAPFVIASSAPMWGMLICAGLLVGFVSVSNRIPNPTVLNLIVFPAAIGLFLLLPIFGSVAGESLSVLIYTAYIFASTFCMFTYITASRTAGIEAACTSACVQVIARIMLLAGLGLGWWFAQMPDGQPLMKTGVVVAACVYMLLAVVIYVAVRGMRGKARPVEIRYVKESFEDASRVKMDEFAARYGLSGRELDVYTCLLKGGTAKSIGDELGLSASTVQGHIRNLYAKLGVNKKERALELFREEKR